MKFFGDFEVSIGILSLPVRERGLKLFTIQPERNLFRVAPCAGAWIEIFILRRLEDRLCVAPCAGAWIEIYFRRRLWSGSLVAPCAGAWIEIMKTLA